MALSARNTSAVVGGCKTTSWDEAGVYGELALWKQMGNLWALIVVNKGQEVHSQNVEVPQGLRRLFKNLTGAGTFY